MIHTMALFLILFFNAWFAHSDQMTQRRHGESLFFDYCSGCHTLRYVSHSQLAMPEVEANRWFGKVPPDLSLTARVHGAQWLATYLTGFYPDTHQPFGVNNRLIPGVSMPNVLAPLQDKTLNALNQQTYQQAIDDIVIFLVYAAEPTKSIRYQIGVGVIIFLGVFFTLCRLVFVKK